MKAGTKIYTKQLKVMITEQDQKDIKTRYAGQNVSEIVRNFLLNTPDNK